MTKKHSRLKIICWCLECSARMLRVFASPNEWAYACPKGCSYIEARRKKLIVPVSDGFIKQLSIECKQKRLDDYKIINHDIINQYHRDYYRANKETVLANKRRWADKNPEQHKAIKKAWWDKNPNYQKERRKHKKEVNKK